MDSNAFSLFHSISLRIASEALLRGSSQAKEGQTFNEFTLFEHRSHLQRRETNPTDRMLATDSAQLLEALCDRLYECVVVCVYVCKRLLARAQ